MARLYTPYRSLLSEADLEDTGGLLAMPRRAPTPVATNPLAEQIRNLYGNRGDWNYGGIDRAAELADLLQKQGITDVSKIALQKGTRQEQQFSGGEDGQMNAVDLPANQVLFGDKRIGFAGDYNNDNTYGTNAGSYLQGDNTLGWSARGHGNVTYKVGTDAQGNNYLMPEWGSSSDMKDVRDAAKAAAVIAAMAYGVPLLGEAVGAAGGTAAAAAPITDAATAAFLEANMGALAPTVSGGFAPVAAASTLAPEVIASTLAPEAAAPSLLSTAAAATPELAAVAPEIAGPGLQTITTIGSKAAAATTPWWAPAAVTAASVPVLGGMTSTAADPYANETAKLERQQPGDLGNMGGPGTPEIPTITTTGPLDGLKAWATANPEIAKLLFSGAGALLNTAGGGGGSGGGGYVDSGYRPTISRGGFNAAPQARQMAPQPTMGLLNTPTTGQPMSGLWRYGLLGG